MADKIAIVQDAVDRGLSSSLPSNKCITAGELEEMIGDSGSSIQYKDLLVLNYTTDMQTVKIGYASISINPLSMKSVLEYADGTYNCTIEVKSAPYFNLCQLIGKDQNYAKVYSEFVNTSMYFGSFYGLGSYDFISNTRLLMCIL